MPHTRVYILFFLLFWPLLVMSQSHDFEVQGFRENATDLTAATSGVRDGNGTRAALIRFAVRDPQFEVEGNLGNLKVERKTGELWVFVPQGTKRLDIRHPSLGILRGYELPMKLKAKTTYDAEIVITGNTSGQPMTEYDDEQPTEESENVYTPDYPVYEDHKYLNEYDQIMNPKPKKTYTRPSTHFLIGAGFNALSVMGPTVSTGFEIGRFFFGADYAFGIKKVEAVGIYYKNGGYTDLGEAYDYSASRLSVRLGFCPSPDASFQFIPQAGVSFNMIKGDEIANEHRNEAQFAESNPISAFVALRVQVKLGDHFCIHVTPQYDFAAAPDDVYKVLKDADSKLKAWVEGFGVNAGILLRF